MLRRAVRVRRDDADVVLAQLTELAPLGVEEADADGLIEFAVYGEADALPTEDALRTLLGDALVAVVDGAVADDWDVRWMTFHEPVLIADRLYVRPPWADRYAGDRPGVRDLAVDPAQAFGTGGHATTRLCLELLVALADEDDAAHGPVLDLGCGSGVLAVAAAQLGWGPVHGVDNEPQSVAATIENAELNDVTVTATGFDLLRDGPAGMPPEAHDDGRPPLILANLLRPLLLRVASDGFADPQPHAVIASGLLVHEVDGIVRAFTPLGLVEGERRESGDWAAVLLRQGG
ncbi:MAG: 50S ribosomal protein L11 methyltransferase [Patulibacter sp.]